MTSTEDLERLVAQNTPLAGGAFLGIFAADQLPDSKSVATLAPCCLIVNYDPHDLPGSHWCAALVQPTDSDCEAIVDDPVPDSVPKEHQRHHRYTPSI